MVSNLLQISTRANNETPLVVNLEKTQVRDIDSSNPKLEQKIVSTSKALFVPPVTLQQPFLRPPALNIIETKSPKFNQSLNQVAPKVPVQSMKMPLIDPKIIAQEKANNERELEQRARLEGELRRHIFESPNYSACCKLSIYAIS